MILQQIKKVWEALNKIHPETRSLIIMILFGYVLYSQIGIVTRQEMQEKSREEALQTKRAEQYSMETSVEICNQVKLISEKDRDAFDVLLLNYHNNTQSLQGYKYLYLSCLTEAPRDLDTPPLRQQWNRIDYVYYADELSKIHNQGIVQIEDIETISNSLPKMYRLIKASDAKAVSFFTIEGHDSAIGIILILYKEPKKYDKDYHGSILPCIQKLAILLDYENVKQ